MRRKFLRLGIVAVALLWACGPSRADQAGEQSAMDTENATAKRPVCQRDTNGEMIEGSPATYVLGPTRLPGCMLDAEGNGIAMASTQVERSSEATITAIGERLTEAGGRYAVQSISSPARYTVTASARGHKPVTKHVLVKKEQTAVLDFVLEPDGTKVPWVTPSGEAVRQGGA